MALLEAFRSIQAVVEGNSSSETPSPRLIEARKKLRWLINNPPTDGKRMDISPDTAMAMMERNKSDEWSNRPHSEKGVARYVKAMKAGWKYTGEPIIFSKSGDLLNGQHRLMACIEAGASFDCLVVFGIDDDAFKYMDIGIARTAAHIFAIEGIANHAVVAAAVRLLLGYKNNTGWRGLAPDVENSVLLDFYYQHQRLQDSLTYSRPLYRELGLSPRWGAFLHYICAEKHREEANGFCGAVSTGIGLTKKSSPAYRIRQRLIQDAMSTSDKLSDSHKGAYFIQAWNAHRAGSGVPSFRWRTAQTPDEAFPRSE